MVIPPTPPVINEANTLVSEVLNESQSLAQNSMSRGLAAVQALANVTVTIPDVAQPALDIPVISVPAVGTAPADPGDLSLVLPPLPADPVQGDIGTLDPGVAPEYDVQPLLLADIPLPDPLAVVLPLAPVLDDVAIPVEPSFTLPEVPDYVALNLPAAPVFDAPLFTDPDPLAPLVPNVDFAWGEIAYKSDELTNLNNRLLSFVQGRSSALPPEVEARQWDKAVEKADDTYFKAVDEISNQVAASGFNLAGGNYVTTMMAAVATNIMANSDESRKIMADQWKLEQSNFQFAFSSAMNLEGQLIQLFNSVQKRALDAAKFRVDSLIQLYNARAQLYAADVQAFAAKAEVFSARLQAALATLEVYKADLEAAKLRGELNVQLADQYQAQVEGVKALAEVFRARVEATTLAVETNKNRTDIYRAEVEAYAEVAKASFQQVTGYLAQVEGEQAKIDIFTAEVSGYASRVDAYRAITDTKLQEADLQFRQLQMFPVEVYRGKIAGFAAQVGAEAARLQATADVFNARIDAYAATEKATAHAATVQAGVAETSTRLYASQAQLAINAATISSRLSMTRAETAQASLRAAGQLSTQLASAALSARNVTASITGSTSNQAGISVTNNDSVSSNNTTSTSSNNSHNRSSSNQHSMGGGVNITHSYVMADNQTASDTVNQQVSNSTTQSVTNDNRKEARNQKVTGYGQRTEFNTQNIYTHHD